MTTLTNFLRETVQIHDASEHAARSHARSALEGVAGAQARARSGPQSAPNMSPVMAARLLVAWIGGGEAQDAMRRVSRLFMTPAGAGIVSEAAKGPGDEGYDEDPQAALKALPRDPFTGEGTFGGAVVRIMSDPVLAARIARIEVRHGFEDAVIVGVDGTISRFCGRETMREVVASQRVQTLGYLTTPGLVLIANLIRQ